MGHKYIIFIDSNNNGGAIVLRHVNWVMGVPTYEQYKVCKSIDIAVDVVTRQESKEGDV